MWRRHNLTEEAIYWMKMNKNCSLYHFGTQPILYLVVDNNWDRAHKYWNVDGLGRSKRIPDQTIKKAFILHWSGKSMQWLYICYHYSCWNIYNQTMPFYSQINHGTRIRSMPNTGHHTEIRSAKTLQRKDALQKQTVMKFVEYRKIWLWKSEKNWRIDKTLFNINHKLVWYDL